MFGTTVKVEIWGAPTVESQVSTMGSDETCQGYFGVVPVGGEIRRNVEPRIWLEPYVDYCGVQRVCPLEMLNYF